MKKLVLNIAVALVCLHSYSSQAGIVSIFDTGWTDITVAPAHGPVAEDKTGNFNYVYPGWGGQTFDAEYIFYKIDGDRLSVGLQTGFDIVNGEQLHGGKNYYAGDLALSFNGVTLGDANSYEYAVDFGFHTKDYYGGDTGQQSAGLYTDIEWNNHIYFDGAGGHVNGGESKDSSAPYAMSENNLVDNVGFSGFSGSEEVNGQMSFYQVATFDINVSDITYLDAHWTMSCGNDAVDGHLDFSTVPEPSVLLLMTTGLLGLLGTAASRRKKKTS